MPVTGTAPFAALVAGAVALASSRMTRTVSAVKALGLLEVRVLPPGAVCVGLAMAWAPFL